MERQPGADQRIASHWYEGLRVIAPILVLGALAVAALWPLVRPAPPSRVVIATGPEGSSYNDYAASYAQLFAEHGITLEIRKTNGSRQNYELLADPNSDVEVALVQGGTAPSLDQLKDLEAVCAVSFEPLFILYRAQESDPPVARLNDFKGKRIAVGKPEGGTYWLSMPMLTLHGIGTPDDKESKIVQVSGATSAGMLKAGEVDVSFFSVSADTGYIRETLLTPGIRIFSLKHPAAYKMQFDFITTVTLYEGSLDLSRDIPPHDVEMVAPVTALVARKSTHKAILRLLVDAVQRVHVKRDPLSTGTFPSLDYTELPIGADARYFFTNQPNWLHRTLPFWLASLLDRMLIVLVPLLVILIPLFRLAPRIYQWRMRARVYKWYGRIRELDEKLLVESSPEQRRADLEEAEQLEKEITAACKVPLGHMEHFYDLRMHLAHVRKELDERAK
jgi:TRAP-type uncharacterized transport system substrate-binding protein